MTSIGLGVTMIVTPDQGGSLSAFWPVIALVLETTGEASPASFILAGLAGIGLRQAIKGEMDAKNQDRARGARGIDPEPPGGFGSG